MRRSRARRWRPTTPTCWCTAPCTPRAGTTSRRRKPRPWRRASARSWPAWASPTLTLTFTPTDERPPSPRLTGTPMQEALYAEMFDLAPVSLWLEDFSGVKAIFDRWRAEGVSDLRAHMLADPRRVGECSHAIAVLKVNRRTHSTVRADAPPGHEADWSRVLVAVEDSTDRSRSERALRRSEQHAKGLFEHSPVSLWLEDFSGIRSMLEEL